MQLSETILIEELDRLIHSTVLRIEQQGFNVEECSASPSQVAHAQRVLDQMIEGLRRLKLRRAQFAPNRTSGHAFSQVEKAPGPGISMPKD